MENVKEILKMGQNVNINGRKYTTIGCISYIEDWYKWKEYKLKSEFNDILWLSYEIDEGEKIYSIHKEENGIKYYESDNQLTYNNISYNLIEEGYEKVNSYWGQVDVDLNETAKTKEFRDSSNKKIITIENWSGELEKSTGEIIDITDIEIQNEFEKVPATKNAKNNGKSIAIIIIIMLIACIGVIGLSSNANNKSIRNYLEKSSEYTYVTSITNEKNNEKAKIYESSTSVDTTVKDIIDNVPTQIQTVTDISESTQSTIEDASEDGIGILTKSEYAYVYTSKDGKTYIQVSSKKYLNSNEDKNAYHSRTMYHHYYRSYTTNSKSSEYTSYTTSARQYSTNSRKSSGGGTSAGK